MEGDLAVPILICISNIFRDVASCLYEDSDEDNFEDNVKDNIENNKKKKRKIIPNNSSGIEVMKLDYIERIVPSLTAMEFKNHFRMLPQTFEFILKETAVQLQKTTSGNPIPPEKQLLIALWCMGTSDPWKSIHTGFKVEKNTVVRTVYRITQTLCNLASRFIQWPAEVRIEKIIQGFFHIGAFPQTIGAIDSTHINISAPKENCEAYVNRKGHYSIQAQIVCDHKGLFTHVNVGNAGSVHDAHVFRLSSLQKHILDPTKFPNDSHLIGDAAYPLLNQLMIPYTDTYNGHFTQRQKNYNFCLSSCHMSVKRAIGLLKGRWRSLLHKLSMKSTEHIPYYFLACCVLHNICFMRNDGYELKMDELEILVNNEETVHMPEIEAQGRNRDEAKAKRNVICATLRMRNIKQIHKV